MPQADTPNTDWTARIGPLEKQIDERQHVQVALKERLRFEPFIVSATFVNLPS